MRLIVGRSSSTHHQPGTVVRRAAYRRPYAKPPFAAEAGKTTCVRRACMTRVATPARRQLAAIAFGVSWKPFVNSNPSTPGLARGEARRSWARAGAHARACVSARAHARTRDTWSGGVL